MEEYRLYRGLFASHCKSLRFSLSDNVKQLEGFELRDNMMLVKFLKIAPSAMLKIDCMMTRLETELLLSIQIEMGKIAVGGVRESWIQDIF